MGAASQHNGHMATPAPHPTGTPSAAGPALGRVDAASDRIALGMLAVALTVSLGLRGVAEVVSENWVALVTLTLVLVGYRIWLLRTRPDGAVRAIGYWATLPVVLALIWLSPLYGAYSFLGYIEGPMLVGSGWRRVATMASTAAVTAFAQLGGPRSVLATVPLYLLFLAVNLGIAALISMLEVRRERGVRALHDTVSELRASEARTAALTEQLVEQAREAGVADERARLSREIHDSVAQGLVGVVTQLEAVLGDDDPPLGQAQATRVALARDTAKDALAEARRAVAALASPRLDTDSLPAALARLAGDVGERTGLAVGTHVDGTPAASPHDGELLRIAQEGLSNVVRHAQASRAMLTLAYSPNEIRLDVADDGRGFDPSAVGGHGLVGVRDRVGRLGGEFVIETEEGGGCTLSAAIPR